MLLTFVPCSRNLITLSRRGLELVDLDTGEIKQL
jgi:hypothetical protein